MKKKNLIIICIILALLIILGLITSYIDSARVRNAVEPKYTIKIVTDKGSKVTYWGLGYKVIRYTSVSPNEPYKNNIGVKYGNWFMKYELPEEVNISLEDVNTKIIEYFSKDNVDMTNFVDNYVDYKNNVVVVGLIDNSKEKQEEFIYNVYGSCCGSKYIKYIKDNEMLEFRKADKLTNSDKILFTM